MSSSCEAVENPSGNHHVSRNNGSGRSGQEALLRKEFDGGIYRKKIAAVIFDARRLPFPEMFRDAAMEAALTFTLNRSGKMIGIDHKQIATMVFERCEPEFPKWQAIASFDELRSALVRRIRTETLDAAIELYAGIPQVAEAEGGRRQRAFAFDE